MALSAHRRRDHRCAREPGRARPTELVRRVNVAFVLVSHLLAIWVAHAIAFDLSPGRLQAIRSEYPFVAVMISYTVISLWLISLPSAPLAYV